MSNLLRQGELSLDKILASNKVEEVPLSIIQLNFLQLAMTLSPRVLSLVEFIQNGGTIDPIHVTVSALGYTLLDGHNRYIAYKLLGKEYITVYYDPGENK